MTPARTFAHNANFFLFATLEHARPVAQARGMPAPAPAPVLTGVPVSGMAYLDRPNPAGYFIFPDLSVRHEGRYRLRFGLYEHSNEETSFNQSQDPLEPREFCTHRLDVKSKAFTVFSAKKFPGLAESTALSRIVAEQGCRVRIRRDVRMRRRNERVRGRDSEEMDETALLRAGRNGSTDQYDIENHIQAQNAQQPPAPQYHQPPPPPQYSMHRSNSLDARKRSGSDVSVASVAENDQQPQRYNSTGGYMPPVTNHYQAPPPPPPPASQPQHLSFGSSTHSVQPPAPPPPAPTYSQQPPAQDMYGRGGYQGQYQAPPPPPPPPSSYHSSRESTMAAQSQNGDRRDSVDQYRQRRDSDVAYHAPTHYRPSTPLAQQPQYNGPMQNGYNGQAQQYAPQVPYTQPQPQQALPPIRLPALPPLEPRVWSGQPTTPGATAPSQYSAPNPVPAPPSQQRTAAPPPPPVAPSQIAPPNPSQFSAYYPSGSSGYAPTTPASQAPQPPATDSSKKRQWGRVFNTAHTEGSMRSGMRPDIESDMYGSDATPFSADTEDDGYDDINKLKMTYRRADGVEIVRKLTGGI